MTIREDSMLLDPGSKVELFKLDATVINAGAGIVYFHKYQHEGPITWQGQAYQPWPIQVEGFAKAGDRPPTPTLTAANLDGSMTALCQLYDDMVGAILTRKMTLSKYLDAVNFVGGNPTANPAEQFPDELWFLDRKESEDHTAVRWALASAMDFNGVNLPRRIVVANQCPWRYRDGNCGYSGGPVADKNDVPTSDMAQDDCSKRPSGCKLRFGQNSPLPYGSFPAAGLMRT